jgi:hypothetical protein
MYRAGPVPPETGRTGPVPTGLGNPGGCHSSPSTPRRSWCEDGGCGSLLPVARFNRKMENKIVKKTNKKEELMNPAGRHRRSGPSGLPALGPVHPAAAGSMVSLSRPPLSHALAWSCLSRRMIRREKLVGHPAGWSCSPRYRPRATTRGAARWTITALCPPHLDRQMIGKRNIMGVCSRRGPAVECFTVLSQRDKLLGGPTTWMKEEREINRADERFRAIANSTLRGFFLNIVNLVFTNVIILTF